MVSTGSVERREESFMRERHDAERDKAAELHAKAAAAHSTVGVSKQPGGGGRMGGEGGGGRR